MTSLRFRRRTRGRPGLGETQAGTLGLGVAALRAPAPRPARPANLPALIGTALVAIAGCFGMVIGDGSPMTWLGILAFLAGLFGFIATNLMGVR